MPKSQYKYLFFIANSLVNSAVPSDRDLIDTVACGFQVPEECGPAVCRQDGVQCCDGDRFFSPRRGHSPADEVLGLQGEGSSGERAAAMQGRCAGLLAQAGWGTARTLNALSRGTGLSPQHKTYLWDTVQPEGTGTGCVLCVVSHKHLVVTYHV